MEMYSIMHMILVLISLLDLNALKNETLLVVFVRRRSSGDLYSYSNSRSYRGACHNSTKSFLVSEKRCISNEELISGNTILNTINSNRVLYLYFNRL